jgi:hypothetical protein
MSAVEEAYELVDAIDCEDDDKIMEEAGDILLQAVFHAVMKEETGAFNLTDVLTGLCEKLIFRHFVRRCGGQKWDESGARYRLFFSGEIGCKKKVRPFSKKA